MRWVGDSPSVASPATRASFLATLSRSPFIRPRSTPVRFKIGCSKTNGRPPTSRVTTNSPTQPTSPIFIATMCRLLPPARTPRRNRVRAPSGSRKPIKPVSNPFLTPARTGGRTPSHRFPAHSVGRKPPSHAPSPASPSIFDSATAARRRRPPPPMVPPTPWSHAFWARVGGRHSTRGSFLTKTPLKGAWSCGTAPSKLGTEPIPPTSPGIGNIAANSSRRISTSSGRPPNGWSITSKTPPMARSWRGGCAKFATSTATRCKSNGTRWKATLPT